MGSESTMAVESAIPKIASAVVGWPIVFAYQPGTVSSPFLPAAKVDGQNMHARIDPTAAQQSLTVRGEDCDGERIEDIKKYPGSRPGCQRTQGVSPLVTSGVDGLEPLQADRDGIALRGRPRSSLILRRRLKEGLAFSYRARGKGAN